MKILAILNDFFKCFRKKALYSRRGVKISVLRNTIPFRNNPIYVSVYQGDSEIRKQNFRDQNFREQNFREQNFREQTI